MGLTNMPFPDKNFKKFLWSKSPQWIDAAVHRFCLLDVCTSACVQCRIEVGAGGRQVNSVDVVGSRTPRLDLTLHHVDNIRYTLDELPERRSQLGVSTPAWQHHLVPVTIFTRRLTTATTMIQQGWDPRGLSSTSRTAQGQKSWPLPWPQRGLALA